MFLKKLAAIYLTTRIYRDNTIEIFSALKNVVLI